MKRTFLALLVAIGIFAGVEILFLIIGSFLLASGTPKDASGLPSGPSANEQMVATMNGLGLVAGLALAVIGGIVFGLQGRKP